MIDSPQQLVPRFMSKDWALIATVRSHPFLMSDNPLALQNLIERPNRGNLGLGVLGIEIYFPLSPVRALAIWCRSLTAAVLRPVKNPAHDDNANRDRAKVSELAVTLTTGRPLNYAKENVENFNSLQVSGSERFLFSCADEFEFAREMLAAHPSLVSGPRIRTH